MPAKKKTTSKKKSTRSSTAAPLRDRMVVAALTLAAHDGWGALSPARLAEELIEPLGPVIAACPTRDCLAIHVIRRVDHEVLNQIRSVEAGDSPRDRLFDVMMARFDVLQANRAGHTALIRYVRRRPGLLLMLGPQILHSMTLMLTASGIGADGVIGMIRAKALAAAYATVVRTWLKDDSKDMAATMSALDKALGRLESAAKMLRGTKAKPKGKNKKS